MYSQCCSGEWLQDDRRLVMHGYAAGASALRRLMRSARAMRMQNRVFGGLLMAVGAGLFFVKRGGQHA